MLMILCDISTNNIFSNRINTIKQKTIDNSPVTSSVTLNSNYYVNVIFIRKSIFHRILVFPAFPEFTVNTTSS